MYALPETMDFEIMMELICTIGFVINVNGWVILRDKTQDTLYRDHVYYSQRQIITLWLAVVAQICRNVVDVSILGSVMSKLHNFDYQWMYISE